MVCGHYAYAEAPLFDWIREVFDHSRNNYNKVGHREVYQVWAKVKEIKVAVEENDKIISLIQVSTLIKQYAVRVFV
jgi:uncharacterized membrane protein YjdF